MYHSFERIMADSMVDDNGREWIVTEPDGWDEDYIHGYDDGEWIDTDDSFPEDMQGEEEFA